MKQFYEDLKKDYLVPSEYIRQYLDISRVYENMRYSFHRSSFMQFLRENIIDYDFFIHAALVKYKGKLYLIIGDKGCGKTSSTLYFYMNGGEVYTDELVYFKNNKIYSVGRNLALEQTSIEDYFPSFKKLIWKKIQSKLNELPKYLLDIKLKENEKGFNYLDKIIVLIPQNNEKIHLSKREKYEIIERQFFVNESIDNINISKLCDTPIEILMISELKERICNEKNKHYKNTRYY